MTAAPAGRALLWRSRHALTLLGMGAALPPPWDTPSLLSHVEGRFGVPVARRGGLIAKRLNIRSRCLSRPLLERREAAVAGAANADLGARALRAALAEAGLEADDLGYLIGHTTSPDTLLPPNVAWIAERLSYRGPFAEFRQACVGFGSALAFAFGLLREPDAAPVAVVGSETGSLAFDPRRAGEDLGQLVNLVQMGDGAAAIILGSGIPGSGGAPGRGRLEAAFAGQAGWRRPPGFSLERGPGAETEFAHDVKGVRRFGLELFDQGVAALVDAGRPAAEADLVVPHQANGRMDQVLAERYGWGPERVFVQADRLGNTGSAAIWLALEEARRRLRPGGRIAVLGAEATKYMFAGFSFQAAS